MCAMRPSIWYRIFGPPSGIKTDFYGKNCCSVKALFEKQALTSTVKQEVPELFQLVANFGI